MHDDVAARGQTGPWVGDEAGSEAGPAGEAVINYYFPVLIEVVGELPVAELRRVADHVFDELDRELVTRV